MHRGEAPGFIPVPFKGPPPKGPPGGMPPLPGKAGPKGVRGSDEVFHRVPIRMSSF